MSVLLVADVGVRRVRISAPELRAGYGAIRRRLGYLDDQPVSGVRGAVSAPHARTDAEPALGLVSALGSHAQASAVRSRAPAVTTQSSRLLAAKRRASRR